MKYRLLAGLLLVSTFSHAHSRLKPSDVVKIRSTNPGIKQGPCGGLPRVTTPAILTSGQTITVNWEETIYHPGKFEFYFSAANDQNFTLLKTVMNDQNNQNLPHQFSTTLVLPKVECQNCTLQMIQVMLENPASPTNYYSCADMQLKAGSMPVPTPVATPTPSVTPTATPKETCPVP